ncbi:MAG: type VI secretion system tip protein VgrG [Syntrophobacter sp.]
MANIQATQAQKQVEITTPLGRDVLLFNQMRATEALGRLFELDIDLLSENPNIKFEDLLGQKITIRLELPHGRKRYFSGHVTSFSQMGTLANLFVYHAVVHPWLWILTRRANCRIFQDKTIPDIIKEIFRDHGFTDYEEALSGRYQPWEYCVQYRETDFNFVSRLMEQQGIYYYFKHENDKHTLVLSDSVSAHQPFPGYASIPYFPLEENLRRERDHIYSWSVSQEVQTGTYALNDFDFKRPKANLHVKSAITRQHAASQMEVYDYPGKYFQTDEGEAYARARIEELQSDYEHLHGEGNARGLAVGSLFQLTGFSRQDQNREYLIVSATHELISGQYETLASAGHGPPDIYQCKFTAIPSRQPFRPARTTYKPIVQGPQTAIVVGPSGSEIYTDKYSRVKVQFHWDRYGKYDQNSSCWIRVSQVWAGAKWGAIHIPRIGQEVVVDFLEGDPDRPIITGRVYNNDNMPPYELPANATQSGVKTRSSKGGSPSNINELRFEDKKGQEMIFLQAEKDYEVRVKNDCIKIVENETHLIVKKNQLEEVQGDKHVKIKGDLREKVDGSVMTTVGMDMLRKVNARYALEAGSEIHLKAGMNVVIEAGMSITLRAGAGFIKIGPSGVTIAGSPVLINSGGSPGSGSGCSPDTPKAPREPGKSSEVQKETLPPPPQTPSPMSKAFRSAAVAGAPFCEHEEWGG